MSRRQFHIRRGRARTAAPAPAAAAEIPPYGEMVKLSNDELAALAASQGIEFSGGRFKVASALNKRRDV